MNFYTSAYREFNLDETAFFKAFPKRPPDAHKGSNGRILLISGSFGMAGAACLNILGAKALGAPYIHVMLPESIYPIVASRHVTPVYHPFGEYSKKRPEDILLQKYDIIAFGSGASNNEDKANILNTLRERCTVPLVLDADAIRMLSGKPKITKGFGGFNCPVIITPHLVEFTTLTDFTEEQVLSDPVKHAVKCAESNSIITVLKGPNTVVASPEGRVYINQTGNQGLAQAGSGDVLTGMIAAMLSFVHDPFEAACMAVFAHGLAADRLCQTYSKQCMPLEQIPHAMDELFFEHGF